MTECIINFDLSIFGIIKRSQFKAIIKQEGIKVGDDLKFDNEENLETPAGICLKVQKINIEAEFDASDNFIYCGIVVDGKTLKSGAKETIAKECGYDSLMHLSDRVWRRQGGTGNAYLIEWGFPFEKLQIGTFYQDAMGNKIEILEVDPRTQILWAMDTKLDDGNATTRYSWDGKLAVELENDLGDLILQVAP